MPKSDTNNEQWLDNILDKLYQTAYIDGAENAHKGSVESFTLRKQSVKSVTENLNKQLNKKIAHQQAISELKGRQNELSKMLGFKNYEIYIVERLATLNQQLKKLEGKNNES